MRSKLLARAFAVVCLCLTISTACMSAPPQARVTGPSGGIPGDILVLDASHSNDASHFAWSVTPRLPEGRPTIMPLEDGKKCLVASVPGVYHVFLAVSNTEGVDLIEWTVTVGSEPAPPAPPGPTPPNPNPPQPNPPGPTPPTPPEPVIPDGVFQIAKPVHDWAMTVQSTQRATEAGLLAGSFESVAAAIAAGTLKQPQEILTALLTANNAALGAGMRAWMAWGTLLGQRLQELFRGGRLATPTDWAACLREVAVGLRAVR